MHVASFLDVQEGQTSKKFGIWRRAIGFCNLTEVFTWIILRKSMTCTGKSSQVWVRWHGMTRLERDRGWHAAKGPGWN